MKIDWIDIGIKITVPIIAVTWGVWYKRWLERPQTSSEQSDPKNSTARSTWRSRVVRFWRSPPAGIVFMAFGILYVIRDCRVFPIVSKGFVLEIVFDALVIAYGGFAYFALSYSRVIRDMLDMAELHHQAIALLAEARESDRGGFSN